MGDDWFMTDDILAIWDFKFGLRTHVNYYQYIA